MTARDYAQLLADAAAESGIRAAGLANAHDLAKTLGDDESAAGYLGQIEGINIVLGILNDKLGNDHD